MHQQVLTRSSRGRPISIHTSWPGNEKPPAPSVGFVGGVHGDEPEGVFLAEKTLGWLKTQDPALLRPWWLIECLNIDGYLAQERTNSRGVDLNRNFPSSDWSPQQKAPRYHPGPAPASEPEVQGLVGWLQQTPTSLLVHAHSWHPCVILTGDQAGPQVAQFAKICGYELKSDIGYPTPGSLGSYGWNSLGVPVLCIEEQEGESNDRTWQRFEPAIPWLFWTQKESLRQGLVI